ncbi:MAG: hypothetical protein UR26_C0002G0018 [candidate division TM6 bacterium GW2011_GWF2_32_72]|nr:MAG: hypothetical protein UR26_C0002G0018 [candidate division TM6 bacterium GW2011_GWF2_32_72]
MKRVLFGLFFLISFGFISIIEASENGSTLQSTEPVGVAAPLELALPTDNPVVEAESLSSESVVVNPSPVEPEASMATNVAIQEVPVAVEPVVVEGIETTVETQPIVESVAVLPTVAAGSDENTNEQEELEELDTLDIEGGGNWYLKRQWWEKAENLYEQVKVALNKVFEARMDFLKIESELDKKLDKFYGTIGFKRGGLDEALTTVQSYLEKEVKEDGDLSDEERILKDKLILNQEKIKNIQKYLDNVDTLWAALNEAIENVRTQVQKARDYDAAAWQNYKAIGKELSDIKAHELCDEIKTHLQNIEQINTYITGELSTYFKTKIVDELNKQIEKISLEMDSLKTDGIDLQQKMLDIMEKEKAEELKKVAEEKEEINKEESKNATTSDKKTVTNGLIATVGSYFVAPFNYIINFFSSVFETIKTWLGLGSSAIVKSELLTKEHELTVPTEPQVAVESAETPKELEMEIPAEEPENVAVESVAKEPFGKPVDGVDQNSSANVRVVQKPITEISVKPSAVVPDALAADQMNDIQEDNSMSDIENETQDAASENTIDSAPTVDEEMAEIQSDEFSPKETEEELDFESNLEDIEE